MSGEKSTDSTLPSKVKLPSKPITKDRSIGTRERDMSNIAPSSPKVQIMRKIMAELNLRE
jgi:hypothetical protein